LSNDKARIAVIEEQFIQSKTGNLETCEDLIYISDNFIAVIDGATSKNGLKWDGKTGGHIAGQIISKTFDEMPDNYSAYQATDLLTKKISDFYVKYNILEKAKNNPNKRISAAIAVLSICRQEVWLIGDCQIIIGDRKLSREMRSDQVLSETRALVLKMALLKGVSYNQLQNDDKGRAFIFPLLQNQGWFQNNPDAGDYWYPVVDGFAIPREGIITSSIPDDVDKIILASDGYPKVMNNLEDTEFYLQDLLAKDPLLFQEYKSTKGKIEGNISYDDRSFIKIKLI
jgi:glycerophosphoryl diester phosphodiesterase